MTPLSSVDDVCEIRSTPLGVCSVARTVYSLRSNDGTRKSVKPVIQSPGDARRSSGVSTASRNAGSGSSRDAPARNGVSRCTASNERLNAVCVIASEIAVWVAPCQRWWWRISHRIRGAAGTVSTSCPTELETAAPMRPARPELAAGTGESERDGERADSESPLRAAAPASTSLLDPVVGRFLRDDHVVWPPRAPASPTSTRSSACGSSSSPASPTCAWPTPPGCRPRSAAGPCRSLPVNRTRWVMDSLEAYRPLVERLAEALGPQDLRRRPTSSTTTAIRSAGCSAGCSRCSSRWCWR